MSPMWMNRCGRSGPAYSSIVEKTSACTWSPVPESPSTSTRNFASVPGTGAVSKKKDEVPPAI